MGNGYIYKVTCLINGKIYIGQHNGKKQNYFASGVKINKEIQKFGKENFKREIIEYCELTELNEKEQFWVKHYNSLSPNGYNLTTGGDTHIMSEETKHKMKVAHTGVKRGPHSEETKRNISNAKKNISKDKKKEISEKRKQTLLDKDKDAFKKIGIKSSLTQKENMKNYGKNNPNFNNRDLLIYNCDNVLMFKIKNYFLIDLCKSEGLPFRALCKSKLSNGSYKLFEKTKPRNESFLKYKGWYCMYE